VIALLGLGIYLILLPLLGVTVTVNAELIGGNYTNVTGDIAASIAAGRTLHVVHQNRKRRNCCTTSTATRPGNSATPTSAD
jgi:hypothetical protein